MPLYVYGLDNTKSETISSAMLSTGYQLDTQLLQGTYFFHSTLTTAQFSQIMVSLFFSLLLTIMHQM
jgi:hypothetical protein